MEDHSDQNKMIELGWKGLYDPRERVLHCRHNDGFFSNCTVLLWNLIELYQLQGALPDRIDCSESFGFYQSETDKQAGFDLYPTLFRTGSDASASLDTKPSLFDHHGIYSLLDYGALAPLVEQYFSPGEEPLRIVETLIEKYELNLDKLIAVVYRGTDKGREIDVASPEDFLRKSQGLLESHPDHKVLIQTDEQRTRDLFVDTLGESCIFFEEMPVTAGSKVLHSQDEEGLQMSRHLFAQRLLAVTHLASRANLVINHTGNMALWVCLFRGGAEKTFQFGSNGKLVTPWAELYYRLALQINRLMGSF